jgi:hypothetical protein
MGGDEHVPDDRDDAAGRRRDPGRSVPAPSGRTGAAAAAALAGERVVGRHAPSGRSRSTFAGRRRRVRRLEAARELAGARVQRFSLR